MSSIPGSVGYISYPMFIEPTIMWVPSGFSGYIWLDTKIVLTKKVQKKIYLNYLDEGERPVSEWNSCELKSSCALQFCDRYREIS